MYACAGDGVAAKSLYMRSKQGYHETRHRAAQDSCPSLCPQLCAFKTHVLFISRIFTYCVSYLGQKKNLKLHEERFQLFKEGTTIFHSKLLTFEVMNCLVRWLN